MPDIVNDRFCELFVEDGIVAGTAHGYGVVNDLLIEAVGQAVVGVLEQNPVVGCNPHLERGECGIVPQAEQGQQHPGLGGKLPAAFIDIIGIQACDDAGDELAAENDGERLGNQMGTDLLLCGGVVVLCERLQINSEELVCLDAQDPAYGGKQADIGKPGSPLPFADGLRRYAKPCREFLLSQLLVLPCAADGVSDFMIHKWPPFLFAFSMLFIVTDCPAGVKQRTVEGKRNRSVSKHRKIQSLTGR